MCSNPSLTFSFIYIYSFFLASLATLSTATSSLILFMIGNPVHTFIANHLNDVTASIFSVVLQRNVGPPWRNSLLQRIEWRQEHRQGQCSWQAWHLAWHSAALRGRRTDHYSHIFWCSTPCPSCVIFGTSNLSGPPFYIFEVHSNIRDV